MFDEHLDALSAYGASAVRIVPTSGEPEDLLGQGGGLADAFDRLGRRQLLGVLADPAVEAALLADGDLVVEVHRAGVGARLVVRWGEQVVVDEAVALPRSAPGFVPDPDREERDVSAALHDPSRPLFVVRDAEGASRWFSGGRYADTAGARPLLGVVPAVDPASLGSAAFRAAHGARWAYVAGAMAGGIGSVELLVAMSRAGLPAFFGAGGLPVEAVEAALVRVRDEAGDGPWGFNLLHNPVEPEVEERTVDLYLRYGVRRVSASAYMELSAAVVRYRLQGIHRDGAGRVVCPNHVFAKVSRVEVAERFLRPAPDGILRELVEAGAITSEQAELARFVPIADDVTAEADSGGHTDRRALLVILPELQRLRDRIHAEQGYAVRPRVGAAGGLGTPAAVWAAFAMGADYVLTGSINQAAREAGTSDIAKALLAAAASTDVTTGPAPDMFELGAHVQVLSRGTLYAQRAQKLYEIYRAWPSMDEIPEAERKKIEKQLFRRPLDEVWAGTEAYWADRDPTQVARANRDARHKMALTFRWYLGMTSRWARVGDEDRKRDYQVWCGPAMGGFNGWAAGTSLADLGDRGVVEIATALVHGAAAHARVAAARAAGLPVPDGADAVGVIA